MIDLLDEVRLDKDILAMLMLNDTPEHTHKAIVQAMQYLTSGLELELDDMEDFNSWLIAEAIIRKNKQERSNK